MIMSDPVIAVENLSKRYVIEHTPDALGYKRYTALRDAIGDAARNLTRKALAAANGRQIFSTDRIEEFWALKGVSFEVQRGEVIGIIGRNGAGKSTLLKVLSRITEPTAGRVILRGRVASLLEVGTGFHPELTGRENIYLNGAILGMTRVEIRKKFDEIVDFAGVEKFIDTPVKRYSSGMYVRLAFAVAAHLEPEILLVDEVLAVGDAEFQKKCLNKMQDVGREGRTVLFVSHNMPAITRLCERAILLGDGLVLGDGPASEVVAGYLKAGLGTTAVREWLGSEAWPTHGVAGLHAVRVRDESGRVTATLDIRRPVRIEMEFQVWEPDHVLMPYFYLMNEEGVVAFTSNDLDPEWRGRPRPCATYISTVWIPGNYLAEGTLFVTAGLTTINPDQRQFLERDVVAFHVVDSLDGDSARGESAKHVRGVVRPLLKWTTDCRLTETAEQAQPIKRR